MHCSALLCLAAKALPNCCCVVDAANLWLDLFQCWLVHQICPWVAAPSQEKRQRLCPVVFPAKLSFLTKRLKIFMPGLIRLHWQLRGWLVEQDSVCECNLARCESTGTSISLDVIGCHWQSLAHLTKEADSWIIWSPGAIYVVTFEVVSGVSTVSCHFLLAKSCKILQAHLFPLAHLEAKKIMENPQRTLLFLSSLLNSFIYSALWLLLGRAQIWVRGRKITFSLAGHVQSFLLDFL